MKFTDILALAKQGYTPADIKDLLSLQIPDESEVKPPEEDHTERAEADEPDQQKDDATPEKDEQVPDYKKLYEETEQKLREAQKTNVTKNIDDPNKKDNGTLLNEIVASFM